MNTLSIIPNNKTDAFAQSVKKFFEENADVTNTFRYYSKRTLDSLNNHIYTALYSLNDKYVGYGHLDRENENVWLGIAVSSQSQNQGIGKQIMRDLTSKYSDTIKLSVDVNNIRAVNLYTKFGFNVVDKLDTYFIMKN